MAHAKLADDLVSTASGLKRRYPPEENDPPANPLGAKLGIAICTSRRRDLTLISNGTERRVQR